MGSSSCLPLSVSVSFQNSQHYIYLQHCFYPSPIHHCFPLMNYSNMSQSSSISTNRFSFYLIIAVAAFLCCIQPSTAANNITDREALLEIKARVTDDPLGVLSSWNDTLHFCEWFGVSCGRRHRRVTIIKLQHTKLTGTISPYIGNLSFLRVLALFNNTFTGIIPLEVTRLQRLTSIWVPLNSFEGAIPSNISSCSRLTQFHVGGNRLVGEIPYEIGSLSQLQFLGMQQNNLSGTIPECLGNLSSLSNLWLDTNTLTGSIPHSLSNLKNMVNLSLSENNLSGIVPHFIYNYSLLETIQLSTNHFQGSLPSDIGLKLPNLIYLAISENMFTGTIPASVSNLSKLEFLELDNNNLHGQVPSLLNLQKLLYLTLGGNFLGKRDQISDLNFIYSLANATMLHVLDIDSNKFKGTLPHRICNFSILTDLSFWDNEISGQLPPCIENLGRLQSLQGQDNQLVGHIPPGIGKLPYLRILNLYGNQISGSIPTTIGNLTLLTDLGLFECNLEGNIPFALGNCRNLQYVNLSQNNLTGRIPAQLFSFPTSIVLLNLSQNYLSGSLPIEVRKLTNLGSLVVADNILSNEIPSTLGACTEIEFLFLEGNVFHGAIPDSFKALKSLQVLDLSRNNFTGIIPKFILSLQLESLNLSYNNLEGEVPIVGIFSNATAVSVLGNSKLCGGIPEFKLLKCDLNKFLLRKPNQRKRLLLAVLCAVFGTIVLVALVSLYAFRYIKQVKKSSASGDSDKVSYKTLLKATNGYSAENLIGGGAFGTVYKGTLDPDRPSVAIKVFNLAIRGGFKSFMAECEALRNIRHRNLVKVITACSSVDYQGNDFKALVYEYMVNGSLEDWLHPTEDFRAEQRDSSPPRTLSFNKRLDIAVDIAFALEYLHQHYEKSIVHCDLKPSNVLLDEDLIARVSDFGLSKFLSEGTSSSEGNQSSSVGVRGTVGYTPPEYGLGNEVSTAGDAYSFGVLLLEIFTGKRPTDVMFQGSLSLCEFVKEAMPDKVTEILDNGIVKDIAEEQSNSSVMLEAAISMFEIAVTCSAEVPQERPDMSDVAVRLLVSALVSFGF